MRGLVISARWEPRGSHQPSPEEEAAQRAHHGSQVWRHPRWEVSDKTEPEITGPHDVLVRTRSVGLCGSDLYLYETDPDGYIRLDYRTSFPISVGHEFSGEVVEVGSAVTKVAVGEGVAVEGMTNCGFCEACRRDLPNVCLHGEDRGFTLDGGTSQLLVVDERSCWGLDGVRDLVGDARAFDIGAVTEPGSIAYHGMFLRAGGFAPGTHVAVFGCGPVGLAAVALARAAGAGQVIAIDTQEKRRDLSLVMGADVCLDPARGDETVQDAIEALTCGLGVGMVVEATGFAAVTMPAVASALGFGGALVLIGIDHGPVPVPTFELQKKCVDIHCSVGHLGGGFPAVLELHRSGRLDLAAMVTAHFSLDDALDALDLLAARTEAKILIHPNG